MAHQGGKLQNNQEKIKMYKWLEQLEFGLCELPVPDLTVFLHMPYQYALLLKQSRSEAPDQHEVDENHLINAENAYLELAKLYKFQTISCVKNDTIRSIKDIHEEVYTLVKKY